jgi:predicted amidohydrolase YtcJ
VKALTTLYRCPDILTATGRPTDRPTALLTDGTTVTWTGHHRHAPGADRVLDLDGALITPAFVDAHTHLTHTGATILGPDLSAARTLEQLLDLVRTAATTTPAGPVTAHGWDPSLLAEHRPPTRTELDRATDHRPTYLSRADYHSAVISTALAHDSGAPRLDGWHPDGLVRRDAHHAALTAIRTRTTTAQRHQRHVAALHAAARAGIATLHEMSTPHLTDEQDLAELAELTTERPAPYGPYDPALPEIICYRAELVDTPQRAAQVLDRLQRAGIRPAGLAGDLCVDGSFGSRTAALAQDYTDAPGERGHLYLNAAQIHDHVTACTLTGLQAGFHTIGDRALRTALDGFEQAARTVGLQALRAAAHRLEHAEALDPAAIARLAHLNLTICAQPAFDAVWGGPDGLYATRLGPRRAAALNPLRPLADAGINLCLGSDSPVTPLSGWAALRACVSHHHPEHRLDAHRALHAHTVNGHRAARRTAGTLAPGAPATLAVWETDDGTDDLPDLLEQTRAEPRCLRTVLRGRVLHERIPSLP